MTPVMTLVHEAACTVVDPANCWALVQQRPPGEKDLVYPAVVYRAVGGETVTTLHTGPHEAATAVRVEVRSTDYAAVVRLSGELVEALRTTARLLALLALVDLYDEELAIYRRIRSVMIRR